MANSTAALPLWQEIPDIPLYMDQVLSLIGQYLSGLPGTSAKELTSSMVNNYVKMGAVPAPVKKRYTRTHLARLIMICLLKGTLPIPAVRELMEKELTHRSEEELYQLFRERFLFAQLQAAEPEDPGAARLTDVERLLTASLQAEARRNQALTLYHQLFPHEPENKKK